MHELEEKVFGHSKHPKYLPLAVEEKRDAIDFVDDHRADRGCPDGWVRVIDCSSHWCRAMANGRVCTRPAVVRDCAHLGTARPIKKVEDAIEKMNLDGSR